MVLIGPFWKKVQEKKKRRDIFINFVKCKLVRGSSDLPTKVETCTCNLHGTSRQIIKLINLDFPTCID